MTDENKRGKILTAKLNLYMALLNLEPEEVTPDDERCGLH
jgi:hypothetical protein